MHNIEVYVDKEELAALREAAARSRRSVAEVVRDAVRSLLKLPAAGPAALWNEKPKRSSVDHDTVHDEH